jgi:type IV pilus assembly protein PilM
MQPGALVPSVHAANITANDAVAAELQSALLSFGGNQRDVGIVVPDAAVRVGIFDFDEFPEDEEEARAVVRLRFRRNVPFDVEDAAISFHRLPAEEARATDEKPGVARAAERAGTRPRVLAVAMPRTVLNEYEGAARNAGYAPGLIVPATLAALDSLDVTEPTMLVRHLPGQEGGTHSTSIAIAHGDDVLLYRSIEGAGAIAPEDVLEDVYPSLVFYEDNFTTPLERVYIDGVPLTGPAGEALATVFQNNAGIAALPLPARSSGQNLSGSTLGAGDTAAVTGALLGRLNINLASQPFRDRRGFLVRWGAVAAAMFLIMAALLSLAVLHWRDRRALDRELARINAHRAELVKEHSEEELFLNEPQNRGTRDRSQLLNSLIARKSFSWTSVFSELERILPTQVRVAAIRPVLTDNNELGVQISVISADPKSALEFIRNIEDTRQFRNAHLLAEQHGNNANDQTDVADRGAAITRYDIAADYVPAPAGAK